MNIEHSGRAVVESIKTKSPNKTESQNIEPEPDSSNFINPPTNTYEVKKSGDPTAVPASDRIAEPQEESKALALTENSQANEASNGANNNLGFFARILATLGLRTNGSLREDLTDALINEDQTSTLFSPEERAMLHNILRLKEVRVENVMVPRADIIGVEESITLSQLLQIFEDSAHSRMPVYSDSLDDPKGMVHIRDVVSHLVKRSTPRKTKTKFNNLDLQRVDLEKTIKELKLIRPVLFVPPSMLVNTLMTRMQADRIQMALVIDEYGGTDGLVSLEDIVEEVVGEIEDEHDDEDGPLITKSGVDCYVADARADLTDVKALIGENFDLGEEAEDVDTLGGLVFALTGRIPVRGELITGFNNFEFRIIDADPRRIKKLEIIEKRSLERPKERRRKMSKSNEKSL